MFIYITVLEIQLKLSDSYDNHHFIIDEVYFRWEFLYVCIIKDLKVDDPK